MLFSNFCPRGQGGGYVKSPRLSTQGGEGVKNGQNLVHVVVECPLEENLSSLLCEIHKPILSQLVLTNDDSTRATSLE